jgi:hypothetical protein
MLGNIVRVTKSVRRTTSRTTISCASARRFGAIYVNGYYVADHEFVVVADKIGSKPSAQFDYGPQSESMTHPGQLVELSATATTTKTGDVKAWNGDPSSHARFEKLNASDAAVVAEGRKMDAALGTPAKPGPVDYSILPQGPTRPIAIQRRALLRTMLFNPSIRERLASNHRTDRMPWSEPSGKSEWQTTPSTPT